MKMLLKLAVLLHTALWAAALAACIVKRAACVGPAEADIFFSDDFIYNVLIFFSALGLTNAGVLAGGVFAPGGDGLRGLRRAVLWSAGAGSVLFYSVIFCLFMGDWGLGDWALVPLAASCVCALAGLILLSALLIKKGALHGKRG